MYAKYLGGTFLLFLSGSQKLPFHTQYSRRIITIATLPAQRAVQVRASALQAAVFKVFVSSLMPVVSALPARDEMPCSSK